MSDFVDVFVDAGAKAAEAEGEKRAEEERQKDKKQKRQKRLKRANLLEARKDAEGRRTLAAAKQQADLNEIGANRGILEESKTGRRKLL